MDDLTHPGNTRAGYRLHRLEVYNWGTFDSTSGHVFSVQPEGRTTLLVGQNGSGKSTLVDAILTLLVPPGIRNYNVAAGARKTERSERSYVRGACGRGSDAARAGVTKYLRPGSRHYSVLQAVFTDQQLDASFTICQILHQTSDGSIEKTYAIADQARRLADDLSGIRRADQVRARLKDCGYRTTKKYVQYNQWLTQRTGMRGKAMDMFNQTVAVKDIQSLNDFIRHHMLESHDWRDKVHRLLGHFSELSAAHRELMRVRHAQELLEPIERVGKIYQRELAALRGAEQMLSAADAYFATQTLRLYEPASAEYRSRQAEAEECKTRLSRRMAETAEDIRRLKNELEHAGGERLRMLPLLVEREQAALEPKRRELIRYRRAMELAGISDADLDAASFAAVRQSFGPLADQAEQELATMLARQEAVVIERSQLQRDLQIDLSELECLRGRTSKLPGHLATLRGQLCKTLKIAESEIPFAAELIALREDQRAWQAATEMVLRSFALSLLVPERYYRRVRAYVEQTRLVDGQGRGQKLVYRCVRNSATEPDSGDRRHPQSLLRKLEFRPRHELTSWVRGEVARRFDYQCCDAAEEFDTAPRLAMTVNRHVKAGHDRHEKDDRPHTVDPRNFVLGWDNREKQQALARRVAELQQRIVEREDQIRTMSARAERCREKMELLRAAMHVDNFDALDVGRHLGTIAALEQERKDAESASGSVRLLRSRLSEAEAEQERIQAERDDALALEREMQQSIAAGENLIRQAQQRLSRAREQGSWERDSEVFAALDEQFADPPLEIETLLTRQQEFLTRTSRAVASMREKIDPIQQQLVSSMSRYLRDFRSEAEDLDARTESLASFLDLLRHIREEDLPRYERRFKDRLNDKVRQEVALFHAALRSEGKMIEEKIALLNRSLGELEYQTGTHMRLEPRPVADREITDFQRSLRECLDDSDDDSDESNEARFAKIEQLVSRLGDSERVRWREKVIDVRRWYDFAAREVDVETGETHSYYEDSSGQSGGEKAKLAFTILVAAIAYQYDLDPLGGSAGRFQFVCVDEMFSKVDDRYAEYAMRLFDQFGLQLLIVAPLDAKARVTEPFVDCYLHVVKDETTKKSQIFSMTAREYETVVGDFYEGPVNAQAESTRSVPR